MSLPTPYYEDELATIYLADSGAVMPLLPDQSVDLVFTDPPYGHNNNDGDLISQWEQATGRGVNGPVRPIAGDGAEADLLVQMLFMESARLLKRPGTICCCCGGGGGPDPQYAKWSRWLDRELCFKQMIVWDKGPIGMGWHYRRSYETVLVATTPGPTRWFDKTAKIENVIRHIPKIIPTAEQHPTVKPVALVQWFMRLHTQPGDVVLDPFMGSGSTVEAAKLMGCRVIGIELEERWAEAAANRLQQGVLF